MVAMYVYAKISRVIIFTCNSINCFYFILYYTLDLNYDLVLSDYLHMFGYKKGCIVCIHTDIQMKVEWMSDNNNIMTEITVTAINI